MKHSHLKRGPWNCLGPVRRSRSRGKFSSPPPEEANSPKSTRGCHPQCCGVDATTMVAQPLDDGPNQPLGGGESIP